MDEQKLDGTYADFNTGKLGVLSLATGGIGVKPMLVLRDEKGKVIKEVLVHGFFRAL